MTQKIEDTKRTLNVHPWHRFAARYIDVNIIAFIFGMLFPTFVTDTNFFWLGIIILFSWIGLESLLMSTWGYTIGKSILKIKVTTDSDKKLNFYEALKRSLRVWFFGLAMGLPIISLVTLYAAYFDLGNKGITSWDKDGGCKVSHREVGYVRGSIAVLLILFFILSSSVGFITKNNSEEALYSLNKDLPRMISEDISLNSISEINNSLVYKYQYIKKDLASIDKTETFTHKAKLTRAACNNAHTKISLQYFKSLIFIYTDRENNQIDYVEINKNDCMKSEIDLYNEKLPVMLDQMTRLNKIYKNNPFVIFDYTIVSASKDSIDLAKLKEVVTPMLIANACQNKEVFTMIPAQWGVVYLYSDNNNQELMSITVFPSNCIDQGK